MTINELIDELLNLQNQHGPEAEVRVAYQPNYPMQVGIDMVVAMDDEPVSTSTVVYIGTEELNDYLPSAAAERLGWRS